MQNTDQQLKEKEERKNKLPQLKVRTDVHSGPCINSCGTFPNCIPTNICEF